MSNTRHITPAELNERLEKLPTRWEVRALILASMVGGQLIPFGEAARAALPFLYLADSLSRLLLR
ncbi:MAG: hypothetical protein HY323_05560 [Betaproteobacteria bacterium]|nr:hypothetical protein [Betaproteobacteria bacterium]